MKKLLGVLLIISLILSATTFAYAEINSELVSEQSQIEQNIVQEEKEVVEVTIDNIHLETSQEGEVALIGEIYEVDSANRAVEIVGYAKYRVIWDGWFHEFEGHWDIRLTNDDAVKGVDGTIIVKKDNFAIFNPIMAQMHVSEQYLYGTLYAHAAGIASDTYDYTEFNDLSKNTDIILQWEDFTVRGVQKDYYVKDGKRKGTIDELSSYPPVS